MREKLMEAILMVVVAFLALFITPVAVLVESRARHSEREDRETTAPASRQCGPSRVRSN